METRYLRELLPNSWWIPSREGVAAVLSASRLPLPLNAGAKELIHTIVINLAYQFDGDEAAAFEEGDRHYLYELTGSNIGRVLHHFSNPSFRSALFHIAAFIASHAGLEARRRGKAVVDEEDVRYVVQRYAEPLYKYIDVGPYRESTQ
jgi:hypothetical protein